MTSGGPHRGMRAALVLIAALVSLTGVVGLGTLSLTLAGSRVIAETHVLPADIRSLTIDAGGVPVSVRLIADDNAEEPRVDLRLLTRSDDSPLTIATDASGSRVTLDHRNSGFLWFGAGGQVDVTFPPAVARGLSVTVENLSGPLIAKADLDQLVAKTDGSVVLGGSARLVDIDVRHGDISTSTRIAVAESFTATAESGNIAVEFRAAPRTTEVVAGGNVAVGVPGPGPYRVRTQSPGSAMVTVPETADPSAPEVTGRSRGGTITITEVR